MSSARRFSSEALPSQPIPSLKSPLSRHFEVFALLQQQAHLSFHHDWSLFTSLAVLNDEFEGGGTYFKRQKLCVKGDVGSVNIHPGNITHKHGARPITSGLRYVIVSFVNSEN